jgi:hypothetical protein
MAATAQWPLLELISGYRELSFWKSSISLRACIRNVAQPTRPIDAVLGGISM